MRTSLFRGATVALATGALVATGASSALADSDHGETQQVVRVVGDGSSVGVSDARLSAGSIQFRVSTTAASGPNGGGSQIGMFRLRDHHTTGQLFAALQEEFSQDPTVAAKGTRDAQATAIFRGLADVEVDTPVTVTENLDRGTYYLVDIGAPSTGGPPAVTTLHVGPARRGVEQDSDLHSQVRVRTPDDTFVAPRDWPHEGTYTFTNVSDTIHFMLLQPVADGTTDAQVQAYFESGQNTPPPFAKMGPTIGNDVVSPGQSLQLSYDLPRGTYVLLCFVADDVTGMPHAAMGMHKVVVLH